MISKVDHISADSSYRVLEQYTFWSRKVWLPVMIQWNNVKLIYELAILKHNYKKAGKSGYFRKVVLT
jgi:hypothetical protein